MTASRRFPSETLGRLDSGKILGVPAGDRHAFTRAWMVVIEGRLFVRSWSDSAGGWFRAFLAEPEGAIQVGEEREASTLELVPR